MPTESKSFSYTNGTRFPSLRSAGRDLASRLEDYRGDDNVVVLGIVLGGTLIAHEVAKHLNSHLDLVIIRRLLAPRESGWPTCPVNVAGWLFIDEELGPRPAIPATPLDYFAADALAELEQRAQICRGGRAPLNLAGKTVILADCGIGSGSTMHAAIRALRVQEPAQIIAAVPVSDPTGHAMVAAVADEIVCLMQPQTFGHAGMWYVDFGRPGDEQVGELLAEQT
ncbi:MAG: phosphoribosyltransferase family protein [Pyrinomonadaceae bacterium]